MPRVLTSSCNTDGVESTVVLTGAASVTRLDPVAAAVSLTFCWSQAFPKDPGRTERVSFIIVHSKLRISIFKATSNFASKDLVSQTRLIARTGDILIRFTYGRPPELYSKRRYPNPRAF